jgi:hypothetical protein
MSNNTCSPPLVEPRRAAYAPRRSHRRQAWLVTIAAALATWMCFASRADAYVYWSTGFSDPGVIGRADTDGSHGLFGFVAPLSSPSALAVEGRHLYWTNMVSSLIGRANLDGSGVDQGFIGGATMPEGIAVDGQHIYWTNPGPGSIGRANLDGTAVDQAFISGLTFPRMLAVDDGHLYWTQGGGAIARANLDGTGVDTNFIPAGAGTPTDVATDGRHLYWTLANTIARANVDGTDVSTSLVTGISPNRLAVDANHIYWTNAAQTAIGRADIDGSHVNEGLVIGSRFNDLAVDADPSGAATASPARVAFDTQALGLLGGARAVTITNGGLGPVHVTRVSIDGADADDFLISSDGCSGRELAPLATCAVRLRFVASGSGLRSATLTVATDAPGAALQIPLSGTGGELPQGPTGPAGPAGLAVATPKPAVSPSVIELRCTTVRAKPKRGAHGDTRRAGRTTTTCMQKRSTSTRSLASATATLMHGKVVDGRGVVLARGTRTRVLLRVLRRPKAGTYHLHLRRGKRRTSLTIVLR